MTLSVKETIQQLTKVEQKHWLGKLPEELWTNDQIRPLEKNFTEEELWDFMFTAREDHLIHHKKIWDCFNKIRYSSFFKLIYDAMDDPDRNWWNIQYKAVL